MKRESLVFIFGFILVFLPFLGIPSMWKRVSYVVLGLVLILIGYQLRRLAYLRSISVSEGERKTEVYVESVAPPVPQEHVVVSETAVPQETKVRRPRTKRV